MSVATTPRSLTPSERAVVELILANDFPGVVELRAQVDFVQVVARWAADSVSVDLVVPEGALPAQGVSGVIPVDATVVDDSGVPSGEILLWATRGYLSAIEYAWYGDEVPRALPDVALIMTEVRA
ncbi:hypothetical protein AB0I91_18915 [Actinosynnema sp. NPDC049800]